MGARSAVQLAIDNRRAATRESEDVDVTWWKNEWPPSEASCPASGIADRALFGILSVSERSWCRCSCRWALCRQDQDLQDLWLQFNGVADSSWSRQCLVDPQTSLHQVMNYVA